MIISESINWPDASGLGNKFGLATRCSSCYAYLKYGDAVSEGFFAVTYVLMVSGCAIVSHEYGYTCPICGFKYGPRLDQ